MFAKIKIIGIQDVEVLRLQSFRISKFSRIKVSRCFEVPDNQGFRVSSFLGIEVIFESEFLDC
jgi:hypothetical protein